MDKNYNIDDILAEIKRKKSNEKEPGRAQRQPSPGHTQPQTRPEPGYTRPQPQTRPEPGYTQPRPEPGYTQPRQQEPGYDDHYAPASDEKHTHDDETVVVGREGGFSFKINVDDAALRDTANINKTGVDNISDTVYDGTKVIPVLKTLTDIDNRGWAKDNDEKSSPYEKEEPDANDSDEYKGPADRDSILRDLGGAKIRLIIRLGVTFVTFLLLIYLAFGKDYALPLPSFMLPEENMRTYLVVNLVIAMLAVITCANTIGSGLIALFTLKADADSMVSLTSVAAVAQSVALIMYPENLSHLFNFGETPVAYIFLPIAVAVLFFNTLGKLFIINRVWMNFRFVSFNDEKKAMLVLEDSDLSRQYTKELKQGKVNVAYGVKAKFLDSFISLSYDGKYSEDINGILGPICAAGAVLITVVSFIISRDIFVALTVLSAVLCVSAPLTGTIIGNLPLYMAAKKLVADGAMISGFDAVEKFQGVKAVIVEAADLFPPKSVTAHGMKVFAKSKVDEAILDAASVLCAQKSTLTDVFTQMVGGKDKILKKIDNVVYEDGMGISAWVGGKRVLVGSAELMKYHGIETPSREYELRYAQGDNEILYISNSGELTAMFVISYCADAQIAKSLDYPIGKEMGLVIYTMDQNLTPKKLSAIFDYPLELITVITSKLHSEYEKMTAPRKKAKAMLAFKGNIASMFRALAATETIKWSIKIGTIIQLIGVAAGYALMTFFAFANSMSTIKLWALLLYQLFWAATAIVASSLRKI